MKHTRKLNKKGYRYFIGYRINTVDKITGNIISYKNCSCVYTAKNFNNHKAKEGLERENDMVYNDYSYRRNIDIISVCKL